MALKPIKLTVPGFVRRLADNSGKSIVEVLDKLPKLKEDILKAYAEESPPEEPEEHIDGVVDDETGQIHWR